VEIFLEFVSLTWQSVCKACSIL